MRVGPSKPHQPDPRYLSMTTPITVQLHHGYCHQEEGLRSTLEVRGLGFIGSHQPFGPGWFKMSFAFLTVLPFWGRFTLPSAPFPSFRACYIFPQICFSFSFMLGSIRPPCWITCLLFLFHKRSLKFVESFLDSLPTSRIGIAFKKS